MRKHKYLVGTVILGIALTAGAATLDSLTRGNTPSGSGQPLCSTGTTAAAWQTPATCGLAPSSSTAANQQPLCGTGAGTAAFESAATCGLAISSNSPSAAGTPLCGSGVGAASFVTPATCYAGGFTVPTVKTTTSLIIGSSGNAITNSLTGTVAISGTIGTSACTNFCTALNGGSGYLIASCPGLPGALIAQGYMDGTANGCVRVCNASSTAATPVSATCFLREFQ